MNQKFLTVLFVTIFYNGVIHASPVTVNAEAALPEEKPPTVLPVTTDHINKKIEPNPAAILNQSLPATEKAAVGLKHSEIPVVENVTQHSDTNNTTIAAPHIVDSKNVTVDSHSKNATTIIDPKNPVPVPDGKNTSESVGGRSTIPTHVTKDTDSPISNPTTASQNPTISTTKAPPITNTPAAKTTVSTLNLTTIAPNTTASEKVVVVHKFPTPAEEKHFDGPSFIGGIVLTIGLTAICFIAYKYYKSGKIDMSYRTL